MSSVRPECPNCGSERTVKYGSLKEKSKQALKYFCNDCKCYFSTYSRTIFWFGHYPPSAVLTAVEFRMRYKLSAAEISRIFGEKFGIKIPKSTISYWVRDFGEQLGELQSKFKPHFSQVWHADEIFVKHVVKLRGAKHRFFDYVWVVYDDQLNIVAIHVSEKRDFQNAKIALQKAKSTAGFSPRILVTDGLQAYGKACHDVFGRETLHEISHFAFDQFFWNGRFWLLSNNCGSR
ncbi:MAG: transposase [Candidatus Micrarchaeota archaeon]